jgi:cell division protein FtsW
MLILLGLLWMVGMPLRYFGVVVGLVALAITAMAVAAPYRLARLTSFTDPFKDAKGTGFHTVEGIYALASGGIFGVGLGQGTSKYGWVPNANSDFVFAIIGEELGLLGCLAVLALFANLAYTGMRVARRSADPFVRLVAGAATVWLCGQAVINIGYVTGLLPVTGIPLPFISAGGTSLLASFFVLGMLVSFARHESPAVAAARRDERLGRRSRLQRWLGVPLPKQYIPPRRRPAASAPPRRRPPAEPHRARKSR